MVMDKIDGLIKRYLEEQRGRFPGKRPDPAYPSSMDIYRYLNEELEGAELERMLDLIRRDEDAQTLILRAREIFWDEEAGMREKAPSAMVERAKSLMGAVRSALCPHCGRSVAALRSPLATQRAWNAVWIVVCLIGFGFSFVFPRYFMQWLLVSALAGFKAIVDMKATRTQIMVYKALSEADEPVGRGKSG